MNASSSSSLPGPHESFCQEIKSMSFQKKLEIVELIENKLTLKLLTALLNYLSSFHTGHSPSTNSQVLIISSEIWQKAQAPFPNYKSPKVYRIKPSKDLLGRWSTT
jgi:hypothetical protein